MQIDAELLQFLVDVREGAYQAGFTDGLAAAEEATRAVQQRVSAVANAIARTPPDPCWAEMGIDPVTADLDELQVAIAQRIAQRRNRFRRDNAAHHSAREAGAA